ncbi:glycine--tRNA ligase [Candidatus Roizmanbacteria bacterium]|nr:glycine--tRNA ligase [Candidatus Roizmanbacteria bacterium]
MEEIIAFCKTRGFVYPSSEIYGGLAGIYDYGHYGILLKNNIQKEWLKSMVQKRSDVYALDSAIFMHPTTWKASGHVDGFNDPQVDCRTCKSRMRADHLLEEFDIDADKATLEFINKELDRLKAEGKVKCVVCGSKDLTPARQFSLMVKTNMGSPTDMLSEENVVYLRPETCGGIYLEYKNTVNSLHPKLPFGIAQVGKAFRNEIVARQFIFRTREFEQMEMQYFLHPSEMESIYEQWHEYRWKWYLDLGIKEEELKWVQHTKLVFYASKAFDIKYHFKAMDKFDEVEGLHARGNYDLTQHSKFSGENLEFYDQQRNEKYIPHIMETSVGLNRLVFMFLDNAYTKEEVNGETRIVLKLDKRLSPIKVAILPLMKKDGLAEKAEEIYQAFREYTMSEFDAAGSIGKRYRRQDEIGTPYCVTVDYQSMQDGTVTVRDRDTMLQERVSIDRLKSYIIEKVGIIN